MGAAAWAFMLLGALLYLLRWKKDAKRRRRSEWSAAIHLNTPSKSTNPKLSPSVSGTIVVQPAPLRLLTTAPEASYRVDDNKRIW